MMTFEILRNRTLVGTVKAVSLRQAVLTAARRYGRCEVIAAKVSKADAIHGPDAHRTEGRGPCNNDAASKARIESIRRAAIAQFASC